MQDSVETVQNIKNRTSIWPPLKIIPLLGTQPEEVKSVCKEIWPLCLLQLHSEEPKDKENQRVNQVMSRFSKGGVHIQWATAQLPERRKRFLFWNSIPGSGLCERSQVQKEKQTPHDLSEPGAHWFAQPGQLASTGDQVLSALPAPHYEHVIPWFTAGARDPNTQQSPYPTHHRQGSSRSWHQHQRAFL